MTHALVIDDDLVTRIAISDYLEEAGFQVSEAATGQDGLAALGADSIDIVLLDVGLPDIDGLEVCRRIRALSEGLHLPVVMMTGHDDEGSVHRTYEAGATDFVAKPLNFGQLMHRLRFLLRAKDVADKLRLSEARLAQAQRIARIGSWEFDLKSRVFECSDQVGEILARDNGLAPTSLEAMFGAVCQEDRDHAHWKFKQGAILGDAYDLEFRVRRQDGSLAFIHQETEYVTDEYGQVLRALGTLQDVSESRAAQAQIRELAFFDNVTGLPNRAFFMERLAEMLALARRKQRKLALMFVDLDQFKRVNDSWGHHAGDELLRQVSDRLNHTLRRCDVVSRIGDADSRTLARLGGDEFVVLLSEIARPEDAGTVARRILEELKRPFTIEDTEIHVSGSIGIASYPDDGTDEQSLLRNADVAMYQVKEEGRNSYRFFTPEMNTRAIERLNMEASLWRALEREEFCLHFQPKVDVGSGRIVGAEALVRWQHPTIGLVSPAQFIPIAEESGIIVPLGSWVLNEACRQLAEWGDHMGEDFQVCVNLSGAQFSQPDLREVIEAALNSSGLAPARLQLELTESILMGDTGRHLQTLEAMRDMGVELSIDDFGTGYSSLAYLKRLPIACLKIDRDFIRDIDEDERDSAIVRGTIALAHSLALRVTAEGVEKAAQRRVLEQLGCDELQGYYFSPPLPPAALVEWVLNWRRDQGATLHALP